MDHKYSYSYSFSYNPYSFDPYTEGGTEGRVTTDIPHTLPGVGDLHSMITTVMTDTETGGEAEETETTRKNTEQYRFIVLFCVYHLPDNVWM